MGCCAVDVGGTRWGTREPLPDWAWTFLERIDRLRSVDRAEDPLTAGEALMVLDSVPASPLGTEVIIDLTDASREEEERAQAKARHPSNASRAIGDITAASAS